MAQTARLGPNEVTYEDVGGEGPPILLTPGTSASAADLRTRFAKLGAIYRLIGWDPPLDDEDRVRDHATMALDLLHHQGIERAIFVGDGEGALVGLRAGLQAPDRVRGLILLDVPDGATPEFDRIDELDIPILVVQTGAGGARGHAATRELAASIRDNRGVHLLDGPAAAVDPTREAEADPLLRDYLESLPA